jgi:hypothetical protein
MAQANDKRCSMPRLKPASEVILNFIACSSG